MWPVEDLPPLNAKPRPELFIAIWSTTKGRNHMAFTEEQLKDIFTYHAPTQEQQGKYLRLREAALAFAKTLVAVTPSSPDQSAAIRKLRECVMTANSSIALDGKF